MPKQHSERWEAERAEFEAALRAQENVTAEGVTMAVSLDGAMVPMKEMPKARNSVAREATRKLGVAP